MRRASESAVGRVELQHGAHTRAVLARTDHQFQAVQLGDAAHDRDAQAAADFGLAVRPVEALPQAQKLLLGQRRSPVLDLQVLAPDAQRGRVVGQVMTGLLLGILLSRVFSGLLGQWVGWRAVYGVGALLVLVIVVQMTISILRERASRPRYQAQPA